MMGILFLLTPQGPLQSRTLRGLVRKSPMLVFDSCLPIRAQWRLTLALATTIATTSTSPTWHSAIGASVLSLAVVPLIVVADLVTFTQALGTIALLDMNEHILFAIIWSDKAKAFVLHEFLHCTSLRHGYDSSDL
jgi:hypothetical protein